MSQYKVTKQLFLDALPAASAIETHLGEYMPGAVPGMFLPGHMTPVLRPHESYYQILPSDSLKTIKESLPPLESLNPADIQGDVYDSGDQLVLKKRLASTLIRQSTLPMRGIAAVSSAVDWMITDCSAWAKRPGLTLQEALARHLKQEHASNLALLNQFSDFLLDIRTDVRQFVGDDVWVVHFHHQRGFDIVLEKTIDFRILDWERRTQTGEWK